MKAIINNENKARFFALYFGQGVRIWQEMPDSLCMVGYAALQPETIKCSYLQLTPLSAITDEDAIEVGYKSAKHVPKGKIWSQPNADYLRGKGYLVPFAGLSESELIECEWAKLREV